MIRLPDICHRHRWMTFVFATLVGGSMLVGGFNGPTPAIAQQGDMQKAKEKFQQGRDLYRQDQFLEAAELFLEAYELSNRSELLYNIGQSYRKAGELEAAENYFEQYLDEMPNASNADKVSTLIMEIQQEMAARQATVHLESETSGREVYLNQEAEPRCTTPCDLSLQPGPYELAIQGEEMRPWTKSVELERSENRSYSVQLKPKAMAGRFSLTGPKSGTLTIGGEKMALPLSEPLALKPGSYPVHIGGAEGTIWEGEVEIEGGETTRVFVPALGSRPTQSSGGLRSGLGFGLTGASLAFATGGVLMGMQADNTHQTLQSSQQTSGYVNPELVQQGKNEQLTANILYGVGAGTFLTGASLLVWDLLAGDDEEETQIPPSKRASGIGLPTPGVAPTVQSVTD